MPVDFSPRSASRVVAITLLGTGLTMAAAVLAALWVTSLEGMMEHRPSALALAVGMTVLLSVPCYYFFASKLRQLAVAHHELALFAARDALTSCLNRGAFVTLVDAYLSQVNAPRPVHGALLVVDADHFKRINDQFGHQQGDDALKLIAGTLASSVRPNDIVGRVGGEEFAVLLPGADADAALSVAERIRLAISRAPFTPRGTYTPLTVSIGAALFRGRVGYEELFESADQLLYEAKSRGRNRTVLGDLPLAA